MSYMGIQFRISEALCILPVFTPAAVPGLAVGCVLANIASPFALYDIIFGSAATLLAALASRALRRFTVKGLPVLSILPPVLFNAGIVGAELSLLSDMPFTSALFILSAAQVAAGEAAVLILLGIPLFFVLKKKKLFD